MVTARMVVRGIHGRRQRPHVLAEFVAGAYVPGQAVGQAVEARAWWSWVAMRS